MSTNRTIGQDQQATASLVLATAAGVHYTTPEDGSNWLGHSGETALVDMALLWGATPEHLQTLRKSANGHIAHLKKFHGLTIENRNGVLRFAIFPSGV